MLSSCKREQEASICIRSNPKYGISSPSLTASLFPCFTLRVRVLQKAGGCVKCSRKASCAQLVISSRWYFPTVDRKEITQHRDNTNTCITRQPHALLIDFVQQDYFYWIFMQFP